MMRATELREWPIVHVFDELADRLVEFAELEEGAVAQFR